MMRHIISIFLLFLVLCSGRAQDYSCLTSENHPRLLYDDGDFRKLKSILRNDGNELIYPCISEVIVEGS